MKDCTNLCGLNKETCDHCKKHYDVSEDFYEAERDTVPGKVTGYLVKDKQGVVQGILNKATHFHELAYINKDTIRKLSPEEMDTEIQELFAEREAEKKAEISAGGTKRQNNGYGTGITDKLKKRFCKDVGASIRIYDDDIFDERIMLAGLEEEYGRFCTEVCAAGGEGKYLDMYDRVREAAINAVKSEYLYEWFIKCDINTKYPLKDYNVPHKNTFNKSNVGKRFISIDLKEANFQAMRYFDGRIVFNKRTYEKFIQMFTNSGHIVKSKYIRQAIFGNLNNKRLSHMQRYIMQLVYGELERYGYGGNIVSFMDDEIVLTCPDELEGGDWPGEKAEKLLSDIEIVTKSCPFHFDRYTLENIEGTGIYIKKYDDGSYDIKCMDHLSMPFVHRLLNGEEPKESDYCFMHEGILSKMLENPLKVQRKY